MFIRIEIYKEKNNKLDRDEFLQHRIDLPPFFDKLNPYTVYILILGFIESFRR